MTETTISDRVLTAQDRCDKCSAAAKVVASFLSGELLFCETLKVKSITIYDPHSELIM